MVLSDSTFVYVIFCKKNTLLNGVLISLCSWREAVVLETNEIDATSLNVQFPGMYGYLLSPSIFRNKLC